MNRDISIRNNLTTNIVSLEENILKYCYVASDYLRPKTPDFEIEIEKIITDDKDMFFRAIQLNKSVMNSFHVTAYQKVFGFIHERELNHCLKKIEDLNRTLDLYNKDLMNLMVIEKVFPENVYIKQIEPFVMKIGDREYTNYLNEKEEAFVIPENSISILKEKDDMKTFLVGIASPKTHDLAYMVKSTEPQVSIRMLIKSAHNKPLKSPPKVY